MGVVTFRSQAEVTPESLSKNMKSYGSLSVKNNSKLIKNIIHLLILLIISSSVNCIKLNSFFTLIVQ